MIDHNFFESSYWGKLPTFLRKQYQNTNWIHISLQNEAKKINSHGLTTLEAIRNINKDRNNLTTPLRRIFVYMENWIQSAVKIL